MYRRVLLYGKPARKKDGYMTRIEGCDDMDGDAVPFRKEILDLSRVIRAGAARLKLPLQNRIFTCRNQTGHVFHKPCILSVARPDLHDEVLGIMAMPLGVFCLLFLWSSSVAWLHLVRHPLVALLRMGNGELIPSF